eukprot:gene19703-23596_t
MKYRYMVCLDGTPSSNRAFSWVQAQALQDESRETEVFILNVLDKFKAEKLDPYFQERKELSEKGIDQFSQSLASNRIPFKSILAETDKDYREAICAYAEKNNVDMALTLSSIDL